MTVNSKKIEDFYFYQMVNRDLGNMYLIYNKSIMAKSSDQILFFHMKKEQHEKKYYWR